MADDIVQSRLWRYVQLVNHSTYFPMLVQGAAHRLNRSVTDRMIAYVASREEVLESMQLRIGGSVDQLLEQLMIENGGAVDLVIHQAVEAYEPPPAE